MRRVPLSFGMKPVEFGAFVSNWWDEINESSQWQDGIFYSLCAAYALVSTVALVSLLFLPISDIPQVFWMWFLDVDFIFELICKFSRSGVAFAVSLLISRTVGLR
ncbi:hypothetical protein L6164_032201 [Bauhinia variegata]|uniref:Uncharacterized protein n=1 Tax=Bauhinia variegata TaxID=167791 RepID=A0ACB9KMY2_BAUVA|nr:hypothetical protein L6164_032201 [Bauhinia variegata]